MAGNILYDGYLGPRMSRSVQVERIRTVVQQELTPVQREIFTAYYLGGQNIARIARERGICKSSVSRTLRRAEIRVRRCLRY